MFYDKFRKLTYDYLKKILQHLNSWTCVWQSYDRT